MCKLSVLFWWPGSIRPSPNHFYTTKLFSAYFYYRPPLCHDEISSSWCFIEKLFRRKDEIWRAFHRFHDVFHSNSSISRSNRNFNPLASKFRHFIDSTTKFHRDSWMGIVVPYVRTIFDKFGRAILTNSWILKYKSRSCLCSTPSDFPLFTWRRPRKSKNVYNCLL